MPFRDVYKQVAKNPENVSENDPVANILSKKHLGATGNLGLSISNAKIQDAQHWVDLEQKKWVDVLENLRV